MFCKNCGSEVMDAAVVCPNCGCPVEKKAKSESGLGLAAKILMIISCVAVGWTLIPLAWLIPMTVSLSNKLKNGEPISTGFKICVFLFANMIAGILLFCMSDEQ